MKVNMALNAIKLSNVTKHYTIHHEKPTLVERFIKKRDEKFLALDNVSLNIPKGQRLGIIGLNGSGKTTLLKIIAGITRPSSGFVRRIGKVVSLIDLEAGFHSDLSGYDNIYLNALIVGMRKEEVDKKITDIISYADVKQFIDIPLYTYSNGMRLHIGFSVAIHANPDIIVLDEGLNVGDEFFYRKACKSILSLNEKGTTVVMASHNPEMLRDICDKIVVVHRGKIIKSGGINLIEEYENQGLF